ncbi:MAG: response regulator transcription factor [Lachnospiraceae bacterium]|nr:response regulator transcription factor [Lachnospiraceae bacterium]
MNRVLVVEDEPEIQELLAAYLRSEGYMVTIAGDGVSALDKFHSIPCNLVLLDIMLPKIDGFGVCKLIRQESDVPIIMLTALDSEIEQLRGFKLKIDDYVTKPFSIPILLQKIAAVLRRSSYTVESDMIQCQNIVLNTASRECYVAGLKIDLTKREFDLLFELAKAPGRVLTREILLNRVWGYDFFGDCRIVDSHIKNLRKKIPEYLIETIRGVGYRVPKSN